MRSLFLLLLGSMLTLAVQAQTQGCNELFFSEYIEGSGNNKCLEIYNPTSSTVSLDGYQIRMYFNGSTTAGFTITLPGAATIAPFGVYVVCATNTTDPGMLAQVDFSSGSSWFNGDDAVELVNDGVVVDRIGIVGVDPGSSWPVGTGSTVDRTLVRKATVSQGSLSWTGSGDTEWDVYAQNTSSFLGAHTSNCFVAGPCSFDEIGREDSGDGCNDNGTPYVDDDTYETSIFVDFSSAPETGDLILEIDGDVVASVSLNTIEGSNYSFDNLTLPADGRPLNVTVRFSDDENCLLSTTLGNNLAPCSTLDPCSYLFFSEYVEGTGNNKCVEIFNPTDVDISLADYGVFLSFNGGTLETTLPLSGMVPAGGTFVLCDDNSAPEFLQSADQVSTANFWNGNDAILLQDANGTIDAIGQRGSAAVYGENVTLRRNFNITAGDNNPNDPFSSSDEWTAYPVNTFWGLGYHANECHPGIGLDVFSIGCGNGSVAQTNQGAIEITNACFGPTIGDAVTMAFSEVCGPVDVSAQVQVISGLGHAGLMYRTAMTNGAPYVWIFTQGNNRVYFAVRSSQNGAPIVNWKWAFNINYLRLVRVGNTFYGMTSTNGTQWNTVFQIAAPLANCGFAGAALHSNVNGAGSVATFSNLNFGGPSLVDANTPLAQAAPLAPAATDASLGNLTPGGLGAELATDLSVSPNPATNWIQVALPAQLVGEANLVIRDLAGRTLLQQPVDASLGSLRLDLPAHLPAGLYVLNLHTHGEVFTTRFVKQ